MRTTRFMFALIAAGALAGLPATARAVDCVGAISLGETNAAYTTGGLGGDPYAANHAPIEIRGVVDCFSDPALGCAVAGNEYTIVYTGFVWFTQKAPGAGPGGAWTLYNFEANQGSFTIYEDPTPDADPANPASYTDGAVFLTGTVGTLDVTFFLETATQAYKGGNFDTGATAALTGGSALGCIQVPGTHCATRLTGGWSVDPDSYPPGYAAHVAGKIDIECPTATEPSTIGRIKAQYR